MAHLDQYLAEVEERASKATPGPWDIKFHQGCGNVFRLDNPQTANEFVAKSQPNLEFIAHSRTDIPRLLEIIRVQSEALKFYANQEVKKSFDGIPMTDVDVMYTGVGRACIAIDKCEEIAKGE